MTKKTYFIPLIALALVAVGAFASSVNADHSWGGYHWARTANPFIITLRDNVTSTWDGYLTTASADWSVDTTVFGVVKVLNTNIVAGNVDPRKCRATAGMVQVCNAAYGKNGWLGIASIWASGSHITQGTVKLNDSYFDTAKYNTPAWKGMVMCQEIGHTFGLGHQDEGFANLNLGTCMDYTSDPSGTAGTNGTLSNMHPNLHDYAQLSTIYAHLDSSNSYSTSAVASAKGGVSEAVQSGQFENASEWGKAIGQDGKGRNNVFERDLGNGNKVLTHVFWAD